MFKESLRCCLSSSLIAVLATVATAMAETPRTIDVPAGELVVALDTLAKGSDIEIVYRRDQLQGIRTQGVKGAVSTQDAVKKLLEGTALRLSTDATTGAMLIAPAAVRPATTHANERENGGVQLARAEADYSESMQKAESSPASAEKSGEDQRSEASPPDDRTKETDVIVTGTRIRGGAVASPKIVLTSREILARGASSGEDILRLLPQNFSGTANRAGYVGPGSTGETSPNLRGLGSDATLVLINGRRIAGSANQDGSTYNLSNVPVNAIDRVEVILDGASAIYGSDAIGGVINIILKKDSGAAFDTTVRYEEGKYGGGGYRLAQSMTRHWGAGRFSGSLSFADIDPVATARLGIDSLDYRAQGGFDRRITDYSQPGSVLLDSTFENIGSLPAGASGQSYSLADFSPDNVMPVDNISLELLPSEKSFGGYASIEQDLGGRYTLFADVLYNESESAVRREAPAIVEAYVPAFNAYNNLGEDVYVSYVFLDEVERGIVPRRLDRADNRRIHLNGGIMMDLPVRDWLAELALTYSTEAARARNHGLDTGFNNSAFFEALESDDPATALNLFGNGGGQNDALLAGLAGVTQAFENRTIVEGLAVKTDGTAFNLPAGPARLALGAEMREEAVDYSQNGSSAVAFNTDELNREVRALFAEFSLPLLGGRPGAQRLDLTLAARMEEYDLFGDFDRDGQGDDKRSLNRTSPKFGLIWNPSSSLRLRATYGESFRAPSILQALRPNSVIPNGFFIVDPLAPGGPAFRIVDLLTGGNPDIGPETATTWTAGVDFTPRFAPLRLSVSFNDTRFTDRLGNTIQFLLNPLLARIVFENPDQFPGAFERDAGGNLTQIAFIPINIAARNTKAVDFAARYELQTGRAGQFVFGFDGVRTLKLDEFVLAGQPGLDLLANGTADKWVWIASADWRRQNYGASLYLNYTAPYDAPVLFPEPGAPGMLEVSSYTTVDLSGYYELSGSGFWQGVTVNAGMRNAFNQSFPYIDSVERLPFDIGKVDLRGRRVFVELRKSF